MSFDEEPDHIPTKEEFESSMLLSDAMEVLRRAAVDGRMDVRVMWDFADELMGFVLQQPGFRPGTIDPDPLGEEQFTPSSPSPVQ